MKTSPPSVAVMKLTRSQYIELCDTLRERAQVAHINARKWANRALEAESRLAIYEPGDRSPVLTAHDDNTRPQARIQPSRTRKG